MLLNTKLIADATGAPDHDHLTINFGQKEKSLGARQAKEIIVFIPRNLKHKFLHGHHIIHFKYIDN